jgi:hypothetical protein
VAVLIAVTARTKPATHDATVVHGAAVMLYQENALVKTPARRILCFAFGSASSPEPYSGVFKFKTY